MSRRIETRGPGIPHPLGADLRDQATASAANATGAISPAARPSTSARRSASSPRSRSASRARSSPCAPSISAAWRRWSISRRSSRTSTARCKIRNRNVVEELAGRADRRWAATWRSSIVDADGTERAVHRMPYGAQLHVDEGDKVKRGERLAEWDPYTRPILTEVDGMVDFEDLVDGVSVTETADEVDRHHQPRRHRLARQSRAAPTCSPAIVDQGQGRQGRSSCRAAAKPATCCRSTPSCRSTRAPR